MPCPNIIFAIRKYNLDKLDGITRVYEATIYWNCECGYENNSYWFYDRNTTYNFTCDGCGEKIKTLPSELA